MRLLAIPMPQVQTARVGVLLRVGSRDETPVTSGIGHMLAMAAEGTATRSAGCARRVAGVHPRI